MTIGGWIIFGVGALIIGIFGFVLAADSDSKIRAVIIILISVILIAALLFGMLWYFDNTASGLRALTDQKSNLSNGLERVINIYTANGDLIATYSGHIDIDTNDGGYVKFDFEGKRYVYYNCFIETIAEIE